SIANFSFIFSNVASEEPKKKHLPPLTLTSWARWENRSAPAIFFILFPDKNLTPATTPTPSGRSMSESIKAFLNSSSFSAIQKEYWLMVLMISFLDGGSFSSVPQKTRYPKKGTSKFVIYPGWLKFMFIERVKVTLKLDY